MVASGLRRMMSTAAPAAAPVKDGLFYSAFESNVMKLMLLNLISETPKETITVTFIKGDDKKVVKVPCAKNKTKHFRSINLINPRSRHQSDPRS